MQSKPGSPLRRTAGADQVRFLRGISGTKYTLHTVKVRRRHLKSFISELSEEVRSIELRTHGRAHPQTVSIFGPELKLKAHLEMEPYIFRHASLDFATIHIYETGTIDAPRNTVDPAVGMGRIVRESLAEIHDGRPFLDTEHGPIHTFKDFRRTLPELFDNEYFSHMQWAHLASGGAGGGMRWPNRHPHSLTSGMRRSQQALSTFLAAAEIAWHRFARRNLNDTLELFRHDSPAADGGESLEPGEPIPCERLARFGCGTEDQAIVYLLRRDTRIKGGQLDPEAAPLHLSLKVPQLTEGRYTLTAYDPCTGNLLTRWPHHLSFQTTLSLPPLVTDCLFVLCRDEAKTSEAQLIPMHRNF